MQVFRPYVDGKRVLHVGCTDFPIFHQDTSLHIKLSNLAAELHGMDVDEAGIEQLRAICPGTYFTSLIDAANENYDTILVPETIEHVGNVETFLRQLDAIAARCLIVTAPNAFHKFKTENRLKVDSGSYVEAVHPDHNAWYSPHTLANVINKYTTWEAGGIYISNSDLMVIVVCTNRK